MGFEQASLCAVCCFLQGGHNGIRATMQALTCHRITSAHADALLMHLYFTCYLFTLSTSLCKNAHFCDEEDSPANIRFVIVHKPPSCQNRRQVSVGRQFGRVGAWQLTCDELTATSSMRVCVHQLRPVKAGIHGAFVFFASLSFVGA